MWDDNLIFKEVRYYTELLNNSKGFMITILEFSRRVAENTTEYVKQQKENSFDLKKFHGFDLEAGAATRCLLKSKPDDIICAVIMGFLPILGKRTGIDAVRLDGIIFVNVELKSSYTDETRFHKSKKNAIYSVTPGKQTISGQAFSNDTTSLKSTFNATYNIKDNISLKGVDTYLILMDRRNDSIIDCYMIPADRMIELLNTKTISKSGNLQIKFAEFLKLGKKCNTVITVVGFDNWEETLLNTLPLIHVIKSPSKKLSCIHC